MSKPSEVTNYQPGEWVAEKNAIFIGEFDDLIQADVSVPLAHTANLGLRTRWYDAALDLVPDTFNGFAKTVAESKQNGRCGISLDPARYEVELFEKLRNGEAVGKYVIPPLAVVTAIHGLKNAGEYKHRSDKDLPGKLILGASGSGYARWQMSGSSGRYGEEFVRIVDFADGYNSWDFRDGNPYSGRACFAELVG
jgi:hypothetical protein